LNVPRESGLDFDWHGALRAKRWVLAALHSVRQERRHGLLTAALSGQEGFFEKGPWFGTGCWQALEDADGGEWLLSS
jgi:hypothetical protein